MTAGGRSEPTGRVLAIRANHLVVGRNQSVVTDGVVVIVGDRIDHVGPAGGVDLSGIELQHDFGDATLLPGMIDAHVHLSMSAGEGVDQYMLRPRSDLAERIGGVRSQLLRRGVTTVRDLGARADALPYLLDSVGPPSTRIIASGPPITSRGGHFWPLSLEVQGVDQARAAVSHLSVLGAEVIKVIATGGAMTPGTAMGRAQFDLGELRAVIEMAHARRRRVAAHAHGTEGIELAVRAGADTIEHCSWTDVEAEIGEPVPELLDAMTANGQVIVSAGPLSDDLMTWFERGELPETYRARRQLALWRNARAAAERGVTVALATDSAFGAVPDSRDLEYRLRAVVGLAEWPMLDALQAVTGDAAAALGDPGRGVLARGAVADVVVFPGDLTQDLVGLATPLAVWKDGEPVGLAPLEGLVA